VNGFLAVRAKASRLFVRLTAAKLGRYRMPVQADLDRALDSSRDGFNHWRAMTPLSRQAILEKAARLLEDRFEVNSANLTREMGKPLAEAKIEMQVAIDLLRWYGEEGKRIYGRIIPSRFPGHAA
jgi:succinate-semialdehyde dehydrogenase/glutarate-semialdehyde dehydrogenase